MFLTHKAFTQIAEWNSNELRVNYAAIQIRKPLAVEIEQPALILMTKAVFFFTLLKH